MLEQKENTLTNKNTYLEINSDAKNILIYLCRVPVVLPEITLSDW